METCLWRPANHPFTPASILFPSTTHDVWILAALVTYAFTLYWKPTEYFILLVCSTTNSDVSSLLLTGGWDIAVVRDSHSLPFKTFRKTLFFPSSVSFRHPCSYALDICSYIPWSTDRSSTVWCRFKSSSHRKTQPFSTVCSHRF